MASTATSHWIDKKSISCDKIHILLYCCPHQPLVGMTHHGQLMSCSSEAGASGMGSMEIEKKGRFLATSVDASMILVQGPPQLSLWKTVSYIILTGSNILFLLSVLSYYCTLFFFFSLVTRISCLVDLESSLHFQLVSLLDHLEFSALLLRQSDDNDMETGDIWLTTDISLEKSITTQWQRGIPTRSLP